MKHLSDRYVKVFEFKGYDICTLKAAVPAEGDELGYRIDSQNFAGITYNHVEDAINDISRFLL